MELKIEKLDHQGRGIAHLDGKVVFVDNALVNEEVIVEIVKDTKKYLEAKVIEYKKTSPDRAKSKCPYFLECGGCQLRCLSYEKQLEYKKNKVLNILKKYVGIEPDISIVKNKNKYFYRNKIEVKIIDGKYGFYQKNSHDLVEVDRCFNAEEAINVILRSTDFLHIQNGLLTIKTNYNEEVILDIHTKDEENVDIEKLRTKCKLVGIIFNDNILFGTNYFIEVINGLLFKESFNSFFQVNRYINSELFKIVESCIEENSVVADMCSGVGTLSIVAAQKAKKVYSLEINPSSISDGMLNAKMNKKDNIEFLLGDAFSNVGKIQEKLNAILIDPPRSGLNKEALETITNRLPKTICYVSCDPLTLARDLKILLKNYNIKKLYMLDMFTYTYHCESIVVLEKK